MEILLNIVVLFGLLSVGLCFIVLLPTVGQVVMAVFATVFTEKTVARFRGVESGTVQRKGSAPRAAPKPEGHVVTPVWVYVVTYLSLLVLTGATVGVSELGMVQRKAIIAAVIVASIKAGLVITWFMHVKDGPRMHRLILVTSTFFVLIFVTLTMADLSTRTWGLEGQNLPTIAPS
ncbi:MAG: cytochrome C oxidase subunit IV family protein [Myxococcota bacterium]